MVGCLGITAAREAFFGAILNTGLEILQTTGQELTQGIFPLSQAGLEYMGVDISW